VSLFTTNWNGRITPRSWPWHEGAIHNPFPPGPGQLYQRPGFCSLAKSLPCNHPSSPHSYASPVWFTGINQKGICKTLQIAQNDATRRISGRFRTTPVDPLYSLLSIPPIKFTLHNLRDNYRDRLTRLPPHSLLRTLPTYNPILYSRNPINVNTTLLPFTKKSPPSHPSLYLHTPPFLTGHTPASLISPTNHMPPKSSTLLSFPLPHDSLYIILRPLSIDLPFSLVSVVFSKERDMVNGGRCQGATKSEALFKGLLYGLSSIYSSFSDLRFSSVTIFLPSNLPVDILFKLSKHPFLPLSLFWSISSSQIGPAGSSSGDSTLVASRV